MHLALQNAETINRLVDQGEFLLKTFHAEYDKDPGGSNAEFVRGNLTGWRSTLHILYRDSAEDVVNRVLTKTCLTIPEGDVHSVAHSGCRDLLTTSCKVSSFGKVLSHNSAVENRSGSKERFSLYGVVCTLDSDGRRGKFNWNFLLGMVLATGVSAGFWVGVGIVISRVLR